MLKVFDLKNVKKLELFRSFFILKGDGKWVFLYSVHTRVEIVGSGACGFFFREVNSKAQMHSKLKFGRIRFYL